MTTPKPRAIIYHPPGADPALLQAALEHCDRHRYHLDSVCRSWDESSRAAWRDRMVQVVVVGSRIVLPTRRVPRLEVADELIDDMDPSPMARRPRRSPEDVPPPS